LKPNSFEIQRHFGCKGIWLFQSIRWVSRCSTQPTALAGKNGSLDQHLEGLSRRFARKFPCYTSRPATTTTDTAQG
jgi:hypothetical protein